MAILQLNGISLSFGERELLKEITLNLSDKSRTALSGGNGSGKSTLMKIIAGLVKSDSGDIVKDRESRVVYLPQSGIILPGRSVLEDTESAFDFMAPVLEEKASIENRLSRSTEDTSGTAGLLERLDSIQQFIERSGYYSRTEAARTILTGLGFSSADLDRATDEFSGGWQMRIALARVLLSGPDIILLDEPTNYLDLEARNWLESYLGSFRGGFLLVSHDRYFLDSTVNEVAELFNGRLKLYRGNYSAYEKKREQELELLVKQYESQQEEITKLETFINRFRYNASKAPMVQSRIKQLEKIERIEIPESLKHIRFRFPQPPHSGKHVVRLEQLAKNYGSHCVFSGMDSEIMRGEKVVISGRNGAGKSTLMRIIAGADTDYEGTVTLGPGVVSGYFSQDIESAITPGSSVINEIESEAPTHLIPEVRNLLGAFLFRGDDVYKSTDVLSGGEKNRLALLKLLLKPANLLILDEPTNHLDLQSKDVLLSALRDFSGTLVFVSHDRYFIEKLATRVIEIEDGVYRNFPGDYSYYIWKKEQESGESASAANPAGTDGKISAGSACRDGSEESGRLSHEDAKKLKNRLRKLERDEEELLLQLEKAEEELKELHSQLLKQEIYSDPVKARKVQLAIESAESGSADLLNRWEELEELKNTLQDQF